MLGNTIEQSNESRMLRFAVPASQISVLDIRMRPCNPAFVQQYRNEDATFVTLIAESRGSQAKRVVQVREPLRHRSLAR